MDIKHIGTNIAKLRVVRGLTQEELGAKIGLTPSAISNISLRKDRMKLSIRCQKLINDIV